MVDLSAPDRVLLALEQAQKRIRRNAAIPRDVVDLLRDIAGALADSGPLELGVSNDQWLGAQAAAQRGFSGRKWSAKIAIWRLRVFFWRVRGKPSARSRRSGETTRRLLLRGAGKAVATAVAFVWCAALVWTIVPGNLLTSVTVSFVIAVLIFAAAGVHELGSRSRRSALDQLLRQLAPGERPLVECSPKLNPTQSDPRLSTDPSASNRLHLVATDRRLLFLVAKPGDTKHQKWDFEERRNIDFHQITRFTTKAREGPTQVTLESGDERDVFSLPPATTKALLAVLKRRAPQAFAAEQSVATRPVSPSLATRAGWRVRRWLNLR